MGEVANRLSQIKGVPSKTKTDFRSFCLATMMWVHRLGPTSIKEIRVSSPRTYFRRVQTQIEPIRPNTLGLVRWRKEFALHRNLTIFV